MQKVKSNTEILEEILNRIEINVHHLSYKDFDKLTKKRTGKNFEIDFFAKDIKYRVNACFVYNIDKPFIFLHKNEPIEKKIFLLLHEYGHYICFKNECKCIDGWFYDKDILTEYHANKYALKQCYKHNYINIFYSAMKYIKGTLIANKENSKLYKKLLKDYYIMQQVI